ncbi:sulfatase-like hydrolase/transferase [Shimia sp. R10_1]|uniref:sulfatase-like hydrolase/transferase n=1 Tax=Shimia sp. R10_1 TaxID=2821095 RepID=UPI001ADB7373|nr:sulfatase-like hydrolase/transferase [Shimia sp. R10_1]MBO9474802.1 sulfatase-like hydrolase/transferase [Shimia sp. R10_1]
MTKPKRNILMIYADQWRPDMFGATKSFTPHLDELARQGVSFCRHYAQALPCAPSRASLYTGLYAPQHKVTNNAALFGAELKTLGHYLRNAGYVPTLFGYTDTVLAPDHPDADPDNRSKYSILPGMVEGCHQPDDNPQHWLKHLADKGYDTSSLEQVYGPDTSQPNATGGAAGEPARYAAEDSDTAFLTSRLMDWVAKQDQGWCGMLNFLRPHRPTIAPAPYNALVDPMDLRAPVRSATEAGDAATHPYMEQLIATGNAPRKVHQDLSGRIAEVDEKDWRSIRAIHMALMAEIDANVGRLFEKLKENGVWEDTLILFSSDHGEMMFDHHICQQASWHEQCARLPLVVFDPQSQAPEVAGRKVDELTESIDTIPTLLDLLELNIPETLPGRSLAGFLQGETPKVWRDAVFWQFDYGGAVDQAYLDRFDIDRSDCVMSVVRTETHKLAVFPGTPNVLVDLTKDPDEMQNLAGRPEYAAVEAALQTRLDDYHSR